MKFAAPAILAVSTLFAVPGCAVSALAAAASAPTPAARSAAADPVHLKAVQDLLAAMQVEKTLRSVAGRSRYATEAQRAAVYTKIDRTPPADIYRRLAPAMVPVISTETALEMTRFYTSPYGRQVIQKKYTSKPQFVMAGMVEAVPPEEKKERKRPAYVRASKELAEADPVLQHEAFKLLQALDREKR